MKVLMINTFHHPRGGDATYTRSLSALLTGAGHTVVPLAMRHPDNEPSEWEHRFVSWVDPRGTGSWRERLRLARRLFWSSEAARATAALIDEVRPDVAHLQHVHRHLTPSVLGPLRRAGVPVVWTVHDHELVCPAGHLFRQGAPCERCQGHRYTEAIRHRCKWNALGPSVAVAAEKALHHHLGVWEKVDRFLCPSRFLAETLVRFGVAAERVRHQPNFLDIGEHPLGEDAGEGWLYAGRLTEEKGVEVAIAAARRLPEHRLLLCGTGPLEYGLRREAADLRNVHFLGHLSPRRLAETIRGVRAVVVPSRWYENFPYAVLEAQAAGRAVVASRIGGIPEQIDDGVDGLLVTPGDPVELAEAVAGLMADPHRAQRLGLAGRQRVAATLAPADHLDAVLGHYFDVAESR